MTIHSLPSGVSKEDYKALSFKGITLYKIIRYIVLCVFELSSKISEKLTWYKKEHSK